MRKILIGALIAMTALTAKAQEIADETPKAAVNWLTLEEAQALNAEAPRKIFIAFYTDWCGWCKVLNNNTFQNPEVAKYLNALFYPVRFDGQGKEPAVFNGQTFNFNPQHKYHDLAVELLQSNMAFPSTILLIEDSRILIPGYMPPEGLLPILIYFGYNYYQKISWEDFQQLFKIFSEIQL